MPFKSSNIRLLRSLDRRVKISSDDRKFIFIAYRIGWSIRAITRHFADRISRRAIQFVLFPERLEKLVVARRETKAHLKYYSKKKHTAAIQKHRQYKQALLTSDAITLPFATRIRYRRHNFAFPYRVRRYASLLQAKSMATLAAGRGCFAEYGEFIDGEFKRRGEEGRQNLSRRYFAERYQQSKQKGE